MGVKTARISARLSSDSSKRLNEIVHATGRTISDVIEQAIEQYSPEGSRVRAKTPFEIAVENGIIGVAEGSESLSEDYKKLLGSDLELKQKVCEPERDHEKKTQADIKKRRVRKVLVK